MRKPKAGRGRTGAKTPAARPDFGPAMYAAVLILEGLPKFGGIYGIGATPEAAVAHAREWTSNFGGLEVVPCTAAAGEVARQGGGGDTRKFGWIDAPGGQVLATASEAAAAQSRR